MFINSNKLISSTGQITYNGKVVNMKYDIVDGLKTGYTDSAGRCLLASGIKDGRRLISGVFKSNGDAVFTDSRTLLDYGFNNFENKLIVDKENFNESIEIPFTKQKTLNYSPKSSYKVSVLKSAGVDNYSVKTEIFDNELPIKKNQVIGKLDIYNGEEIEHTIDLIANNEVFSLFSIEGGIVKNLIKISAISTASLFLLAFSIRQYNRNKKKKNPYSNVVNYNSRRNRKKYQSMFSNKGKKDIYSTRSYKRR